MPTVSLLSEFCHGGNGDKGISHYHESEADFRFFLREIYAVTAFRKHKETV